MVVVVRVDVEFAAAVVGVVTVRVVVPDVKCVVVVVVATALIV